MREALVQAGDAALAHAPVVLVDDLDVVEDRPVLVPHRVLVALVLRRHVDFWVVGV